MSGLHTKPQETPNQVIANLDDLFTEDGITLSANEHLVLRLGEQHNAASLPPASASVYALKGQPQPRFEGGENTAIGDTTLLRFIKDAPAIPAAQVELHLPNGLALTYGQVVALGGDFYGIPDQPISDGATPEDRTQRLASAFNSLAILPASNAEAKQILAVMQEEINAVNQAIRDGKQPHEAYDALGDTLSEEWNKITCGGSFVSALFPLGRYLKLAANNTDHFAEGALAAYISSHTTAVQQAVLAKNSGDEKQLEIAYAMNAFADHYLTDAAYLSGIAPLPGNFSALKKLPDLQAVLNPAGNFSPLFKVEGSKVLRRKDVNNLNDNATIDDCWGWSTYLLLKDYAPTGNVA